jgi:hypothetical protein
MRPGGRSPKAVAEKLAGRIQLAMAALEAAMAERPALTPFDWAIPVARGAKPIRLEAKAAIVPTAQATGQPLGRWDMGMMSGVSWAGTAKTVAGTPCRIEREKELALLLQFPQ